MRQTVAYNNTLIIKKNIARLMKKYFIVVATI